MTMQPSDNKQILVDLTGSGSATVDITQYVRSVQTRIGIENYQDHMAVVGTATLEIKNMQPGLVFTPNNASGPYFGQLVPRRKIIIKYQDGPTGTWYTEFTGKIAKIVPGSTKTSPDAWQGTIECIDALGEMQDTNMAAQLMLNVRSDAAIQQILNEALGAPQASGVYRADTNPADGQQINVNGTIITFKTTLSGAANEVLIGLRREDTAANLVNAISGAGTPGTDYASTFTRPSGVVANYVPEIPTRATMWHDQATVVSGGALVTAIIASHPYNFVALQSAANGDTTTNSCFLQAGTYTFGVEGSIDTDRGIVDWYIDGVIAISGQDWYGASAFATKTATVTINQDGYHSFKTIINGKNAISSNYKLALSKYWLRKVVD